jgi:pimeloyl-ACP methyl ester carboxylesterase
VPLVVASPVTVRLPDGRRMAVHVVGRPDGFPVLYLHGAIGSPLDCAGELRGALDELGLRLVLVQRPGFGGSDPDPGRTMTGFARDVEHVADALGAARLAIVGVSAGGPYAVACAHELPDRITAAAAVSSLSPMCPPCDVPGLPAHVRVLLRAIAGHPELVTRVGDRMLAALARHPALLARLMALGAAPADRAHLADPGTRRTAAATFIEATAGGVGSLVDDHLVTSRPWGFELGRVAAPVHVWHGMHDRLVPVEHALQLVAALPRCRVFLDPGEGHFFFRRRVREILATVAEADHRFTRTSPAGHERFTG